jgi:hypothetical protein
MGIARWSLKIVNKYTDQTSTGNVELINMEGLNDAGVVWDIYEKRFR